jgi:hypothetical protein
MERPMTNARTGFGWGEGDIQVKSRGVTQPPMSSLLDLIEQTHFLRMLLTDPDRVIPPGKSLLSMLTNAKFNEEKDSPILHGVTQVAHRAFWDEVGTMPLVIISSLRYLKGSRLAFFSFTFSSASETWSLIPGPS